MKDPPNDIQDQLINAVIMAGDTFFGTLLGIGVMGIVQDWRLAFIGAGIAAGFVFFSTLAIQRGLRGRK